MKIPKPHVSAGRLDGEGNNADACYRYHAEWQTPTTNGRTRQPATSSAIGHTAPVQDKLLTVSLGHVLG